MLDEKLHALIRKYGIYDVIGGIIEPVQSNDFWGKIKKYIKLVIGGLRFAWILNEFLNKVGDNEKIALWIGRNSGKFLWAYSLMIFPKNWGKFRYIIQDRKIDILQSEYHGRRVLCSSEMEKYPVDVVVIALLGQERYVHLLQRKFTGKIISMDEIILEKGLSRYFDSIIKRNPYIDIYISSYHKEQSKISSARQIWHKRLIANYIVGRDFLSANKEIHEYIASNYNDVDTYRLFLNEMTIFLENIKKEMSEKRKRDIFIYWLDQMEKDDFFSMKFVGNKCDGMIFNCAYTTIVNTTKVLQSIFSGENVKDGKLSYLKKLKMEKTKNFDHLSDGTNVFALSSGFFGKVDDAFLHNFHKTHGGDTPFMVKMWYALDKALESTENCAFILHCMETHAFYFYGNILDPNYTVLPDMGALPINHPVDYTKSAKDARDYLDERIEWYHQFTSLDSVHIYMSDHGHKVSLGEKTVNVPFKISGTDIINGVENRLFSYKNMYKLIDCLFHKQYPGEDVFSEFAVIDIIDPYDKNYAKVIRTWERYDQFMFERKVVSVDSLKQHLQATKIVTAVGECYTVNILGEETYYIDKECKDNLVNNLSYAKRVAELREKAGKFYNPWKEHREVAIDFYKYLGIEEKDVLDQCY